MAHERRGIKIRGVRRQPVDIKKLGRALIDLAQAQAEADAQAEHERKQRSEAGSDGKEHSADAPEAA